MCAVYSGAVCTIVQCTVALCVQLCSVQWRCVYNCAVYSGAGSSPDGGLLSIVVVSNIFLIGCISLLILFICQLIPHYPAVAWTPSEGYLVPFIMEV